MTPQSFTERQPIRFASPFRGARGKEIVDEHVFYDWLANEGSGSFAVSSSGMWHGGIHVSADSAGRHLDLQYGVRCIATGEIVAYRANSIALASHIAASGGEPAQTGYYSSSFTLVRHTLEYPADNRLTFFSLYMHLQSVAEYAQTSMTAPAYWTRAYEVTGHAADKPQADPHHGAPPAGQVGLNIRAEAGSPTILGILPHGARVRIGEKSKNGRWGRIEAIESGVPMPPRVAGFVDSRADKGWVYLEKERGHLLLNPVVSEALCDQVVVPLTPIRINAGELIGHLGQYWLPDDPARDHRMIHLEVFCGDDLESFLSGSRAAAKKIIDFDKLPLLRIDKGVKLFAGRSIDEEGAHAPETAVVQIYSQATLDALSADCKGPKDDAYGDGQPWWKVTSANSRYEEISGWVRNRQMPPNGGVTRESPHAWKDFDAITGSDAGNPTIFNTVDGWLDYALGEDKPLTGDIGKLKPLACNVYRALSPMRNESQAADEMRALKGHKWLAYRASRLIPKHRSEWASRSEYQNFFQGVLKRVTKEPYHDAEIERLERLVWWDEVRKAVKGPFPSSPEVFHIHPIALVGNFTRSHRFDIDRFVELYKQRHSVEFGWYDEETKTKTSLPPLSPKSEENLRTLLHWIDELYIAKNKNFSGKYVAYMLATVRVESYDWHIGTFFGPILEKISYDKAERNYRCGEMAKNPVRAKKHGNTEVGDGYKYRGRGLVQITRKKNYRVFSRLVGRDLVSNPDDALQWENAARIMVIGMVNGAFTGYKLENFLGGANSDYVGARKIINGADRDWIIADYADNFDRLMRECS
jgi:hypothetical protein